MSDTNQKLEILRDRAKLLRQPKVVENTDETLMEGLAFLLSNEKYLYDSVYIFELLHIENLTPLPCTPNFIVGIINIRGRIVSVIEMKRFLGLPVKGLSNLNKVIVVNNEEIEFGILADEIIGSKKINLEKLQTAKAFEGNQNKGFIQGITAGNLLILDIERIFESNKIIVNEVV